MSLKSDFSVPSVSYNTAFRASAKTRSVVLLIGMGIVGSAATASGAPGAGNSIVRLTRAPYVQWTTPRTTYLVWNTNVPSSSSVDYQLAGSSRKMQNAKRTAPAIRHIVQLTGLHPASAYNYRVASNGHVLAEGRLRTAKLPGQPFRFVVWGDSGTHSSGQKALAAQIVVQDPDFILHTGDLIYPRGAARDYDASFFTIYKTILARVPFYGSLGNHDVLTANGQPFLDNFVLPRNGPSGVTPERNYSFDYADAHIVVIDTNQSEYDLRTKVAPWLAKDLSNSKSVWKFAVFHHPPFSSGPHGDEPRVLRTLVPIFERLKVDVVFNGHDHQYERFAPRHGVVYIVTGAGGAGLYPRRKTVRETRNYNDTTHSVTRIDIRGHTLKALQIAQNGSILDSWTIVK